MEIRDEVLVCMAQRLYFQNKIKKVKNPYPAAYREIMNAYHPQRSFSQMTILKEKIKENGLMRIILDYMNSGKNVYEISSILNSGLIVTKTTPKHQLSDDELIAYRDLETIGGLEYASMDVMSPAELELLHINNEEKTLFLAETLPPVEKPAIVTLSLFPTLTSIRRSVKIRAKNFKTRAEAVQLRLFPSCIQLQLGY